MPFSAGAKDSMLDSLTMDRVRLHSGDPGAAGTANTLGSLEIASFAASSSQARQLSTDVDVVGLAASQSVTHFSVWQNTGTVFHGSGTLSGDLAANTSGEYTLKATTTFLNLTDS